MVIMLRALLTTAVLLTIVGGTAHADTLGRTVHPDTLATDSLFSDIAGGNLICVATNCLIDPGQGGGRDDYSRPQRLHSATAPDVHHLCPPNPNSVRLNS